MYYTTFYGKVPRTVSLAIASVKDERGGKLHMFTSLLCQPVT